MLPSELKPSSSILSMQLVMSQGKVHAKSSYYKKISWSYYEKPLQKEMTFAKFQNILSPWGSHIELQAAASLFEMPVFISTTGLGSQSEQGYKWTCYNPFPPEKLMFPQERPKTLDLLSHIELCHTGGCHFDCVLNKDLNFSLIQPKLHVQHIYLNTVL